MFKKTVSTFILLGACCAPLMAVAQQDDHHDDHTVQQQQYVQHKEWKRGYHMNHDDWDRGQQVDYRSSHLRQPPSGYEWRQIDGNYVMANSGTGVISTVVVVRH